MTKDRAPLVEIFASIQGEGRHVGVPMVFVRTAVCPIRCRYCDTPYSYTVAPTFPVRTAGAVLEVENPVSGARAAELALGCAPQAASPVSVTGGEPLLYPAFVRELGRAVRGRGGALHLETAALDPGALDVALPVVDHLSADYKLPETLRAGDPRAANRRSIELAAGADCTIDVKIVLTPDVADESFAAVLDDLAPFRPRIALVLQPVTPFGEITATVRCHPHSRSILKTGPVPHHPGASGRQA